MTRPSIDHSQESVLEACGLTEEILTNVQKQIMHDLLNCDTQAQFIEKLENGMFSEQSAGSVEFTRAALILLTSVLQQVFISQIGGIEESLYATPDTVQ